MVSRESRDVANGVLSALPIEEAPAMAHRAPAWMENLVEVISECVEAQSPDSTGFVVKYQAIDIVEVIFH
jgi:hypothetical protein